MRCEPSPTGRPPPTGRWHGSSMRSPDLGERTSFELRLDYAGTPFQRSVWDALRAIPYGTTTTYGALARQLDAQPRSRRAHELRAEARLRRHAVPAERLGCAASHPLRDDHHLRGAGPAARCAAPISASARASS